MRLETIHPKELGQADVARWRAHQRAEAGTAGPYLTPEWAQLIGAVRDDARVVVVDSGAGFLGAQRLSGLTAMGLGAPVADYQGLVGEPGLRVDAGALCRALKVGRIDLEFASPGQTLLSGGVAGLDGSWIAEVSGGRDLYEAALKARRAEFVRQTDKKARKFEREHGRVEFRAQSDLRADFESLVAWKNAQLERSNQPPIWKTPWVAKTLDACFDRREATFGGALFTLKLGERLAVAAFCLRSARVLHLWLLAHDSAYDAYSPGVQLTRMICGWAGENGFAEVDFGAGDYQYKRQLAMTQRMLERGVVSGLSASGAARRIAHAARARIERLPQPRLAALPGKAMRRIDLMRALG